MITLNRSVIAPLSSAIITVLIAGLVVAGVDSVDRNNVRPGTARLEPTGLVEISVGGAPFVRASHGRTLGANDQVRVIDGRAVLDLPNSSKVELRAGSALTVNGVGEVELALNDGDLLVESGRGDNVIIDGGTANVQVAGSAKLRRGVSLAAGVYEGTARLLRNEQGLTIPQYRQAAVVGTGILPPAAEPLSLSPQDEWDRRMLGQVMALDEQVTLISKAFEADAPANTTDPAVYKSWIPKAADLPITPELLTGRAVGENLVGLTLVSLDKGDFESRVHQIFGFRAEGASWGIVAADRAINPNPVIGDLEAALGKLHPGQEGLPGGEALAPGRQGGINIGGRIFPITGGSGGSATGTGGTGTGGVGGVGGNGTGGGTGGSGPGGSGGSGGSGGTPGGGTGGGGGKQKLIDLPPTGTFLDPLLDPLLTPVEDLLSGLLGGLLGQGTSSTGSTSTAAPKPGSPVTQPVAGGTASLPASTPPPPTSGGTSTAPTGSTSTPTGGTSGTSSTSDGSLVGGLLGGVVNTLSGGTATTTTTAPPPPSTPTTSPSLLGGVVGGLTKTVGGLL